MVLVFTGGDVLPPQEVEPRTISIEVQPTFLMDEIRADYLVRKARMNRDLAYRIVDAVNRETECYSIEPDRILAIIIVESFGNPKAVSPVGALGLMQVMPATGKFIARSTGFKWSGVESLRAVESNIAYGTWYYDYLLRLYKGDERAAIAAYNWGPDNVSKRLRRNQSLPQVYPGKVYEAEKRLVEDIRDEYNARYWRGLDQYISDSRERRDAARRQNREGHCSFSGHDEQGL
jgi:soluble lytic murein transglycosylase-like protein